MAISFPHEGYSFPLIAQATAEQAYEIIERIAKLAYEYIIKPVAIGVVSGAALFLTNVSLVCLMHGLGLDSVGYDSERAEHYSGAFKSTLTRADVLSIAVVAPIVEEIIFRVVIQGGLNFLLTKLLPDSDIEIFSYKIKLASLIALVASSILFGAAHYFNGLGLIQVVVTTIGGFVFGLLKQEAGLTTSVAAHMTNNAICVALISLA